MVNEEATEIYQSIPQFKKQKPSWKEITEDAIEKAGLKNEDFFILKRD